MIDKTIEILKTAGEISKNLYRRESGHLKADGTWVTRADVHIENFLRNEFKWLFDARIFGEEGGWTGEESAPYVVIIDPIEGTGPFRDQVPIWGISVAIFHEGSPFLGLFNMPAADHFFIGEYGNEDKVFQYDGKPEKMPSLPVSDTSYLGVSSDGHRWNLEDYPGKIRAFGVSAYHTILVALGGLQAAFLTRFNFYDIAAAAIILWATGGNIYYLSGKPVAVDDIIKLEKPKEPVIACHPENIDETLRYIQHRNRNR